MEEKEQESTSQHSSSSKQAVTMTFTMTPTKLFFSGFLIGCLIVGLPLGALLVATQGFGKKDAASLSGGGIVGDSVAGKQIQAPAPQQAGPVPPLSKSDHLFGDPKAPITLIEYSDFECPFCHRFHPTAQKLIEDYKGKVNWVYRHFPLSSIHPNAQKFAEGSECIAELGGNDKFWAFTNKLFGGATEQGIAGLVAVAKEVGVDEKKFTNCLESGKHTKVVLDQSSGGQAAGIDGTPGNIFLTKTGKSVLIAGAVPYEELKSTLEQLLAEK